MLMHELTVSVSCGVGMYFDPHVCFRYCSMFICVFEMWIDVICGRTKVVYCNVCWCKILYGGEQQSCYHC